MNLYEQLNTAFPNQWWFYEIVGLNINDAMDRCARLLGSEGHVVNYQGRIVLASGNELSHVDIPWLNLIGGPPTDIIDVEVTEIKE
jgi:hypothetical protein